MLSLKQISIWTATAVTVMMTGAAQAVDLTVLHTFSKRGTDGAFAPGDVTVDGTTIYGMTRDGGGNDLGTGTVFKMNTDGTGFQTLRSLTYTTDGGAPYGALTKSGSTLYGMTSAYGPGGNYTAGTVFKMNTDGSNFTMLHGFSDKANLDPQNPMGSLTLVGSTLYGMTKAGGVYDASFNSCGTVFKMNTDGTGYETIHAFTGGANGFRPEGSLTLAGSKLYGMTTGDQSSSKGSIFRMDLDGTNFENLYSFVGGANSGTSPVDSLTISGSTMYGTTKYGGDANYGTIFKMNTDGTGFSLIHEFANAAGSGRYPTGSLTLVGSTLVGTTTEAWGSGGTLFKIGTDGSGFEKLLDFNTAAYGYMPMGSLTLSESKLYGMAFTGGVGTYADQYGTVFSFDAPPIPEPATLLLLGLGSLAVLRRRHVQA